VVVSAEVVAAAEVDAAEVAEDTTAVAEDAATAGSLL